MSLQIRSLILNEDRHAADGNLRDDLACLRAKEEMTRDQQNLGCSQWFPVTSYLDRKTLSDDSLHLSHSTNAAMSDPGPGRGLFGIRSVNDFIGIWKSFSTSRRCGYPKISTKFACSFLLSSRSSLYEAFRFNGTSCGK